MPVLTVQIGQAALVGNQRRAGSPWAHSFQDTSSDVDMGSLYLSIEGVNGESASTIAGEVADYYFDNTTVRPETALLRSVRHAYRFLYDSHLDVSLSLVGLTAVVVRDGRASIAQVLPTQFYLLHDGQLTALPESNERSGNRDEGLQPEGRHAQWAPPVEMFRATLAEGDVVALCSENVGIVLSDREIEDILVDGKPQSAAENLVNSARKGGEQDVSALVLRFSEARESLGDAPPPPALTGTGSQSDAAAPTVRSQGNLATAIIGVLLALVVMTGSAVASIFRPRSRTQNQGATPAGVASQSTIVTRDAAAEARRQRVNRIGAGVVVIVVLAILVIVANGIIGREASPTSLTEDVATVTPTTQVTQPAQSTEGAATPTATAQAAVIVTPSVAGEPEPGTVAINEVQELVRFSAGLVPEAIIGLDNTMYVLDSSGAVYRVETTGENEVVYSPGSEGLGSAAQFITGRADVIQILDQDYRLYRVANGELPVAVQLPTALIQQPRASATYDQNFYVLDSAANDVLRFRPVGGDAYGEPEGYFGVNSGVDLSDAVDLAIDGSVFVMFLDGSVQRYEFGRIAEFSLSTIPSPLGSPTAIYISQDMGSLYILDGQNDRVVQVTTLGEYQRQFSAPSSLFADAIDLYVNRGETYLWLVSPTGVTRLPLPELPADAPRSPA